MKPIKLFIVDDDKVFVFLSKKTIESAKVPAEVTVFQDGLEVFDYIKKNLHEPQNLPDIMFLDLNMPVMDGWEFLNEYLQLEKPEKKILLYLLSSSISPHDVERAKSIHAVSDFIIKPLMKEKVLEVTNLLSQ